jgi:tetratricopeptide (TPR) repeat protein
MAKAWKVRAYLIARGARMISWEENLEVAPLAQALLAEAGDDPLVLVFSGQFHAFSGWGQAEGAEAVRRARRLCPNSALVNLAAGWPLSYIGAYDEAIEAFETWHQARSDGRHGDLLPDGGGALSHLCRAGRYGARDHGAGLCRTPVLRDPRAIHGPRLLGCREGGGGAPDGGCPARDRPRRDADLGRLDSTPYRLPNSGN